VKLLLDTHIWLWSMLDRTQLANNVAAALKSDKNELWLSPITLWEVLVLAEKGRISLAVPPHEWITQALSATPIQEAPLTSDVALETARFQLPHRDPADRFLVATARVFGLTLVTADHQLIMAKASPTLANR